MLIFKHFIVLFSFCFIGYVAIDFILLYALLFKSVVCSINNTKCILSENNNNRAFYMVQCGVLSDSVMVFGLNDSTVVPRISRLICHSHSSIECNSALCGSLLLH